MARPIRRSGKKVSIGQAGPGTATLEREEISKGDGEEIERWLRDLLEAMEAVRKGDLTKRLKKEEKDIFGELANSYNSMVDSLSTFGSEVTRVAREVGTEGKLGGQATVEGVSGTWKDLTDNVNTMASNLTNQVRNIAQVTTGVANGDLSQKITVEAQGEILELKSTINGMVDSLSTFGSEVTRVARGTETVNHTIYGAL